MKLKRNHVSGNHKSIEILAGNPNLAKSENNVPISERKAGEEDDDLNRSFLTRDHYSISTLTSSSVGIFSIRNMHEEEKESVTGQGIIAENSTVVDEIERNISLGVSVNNEVDGNEAFPSRFRKAGPYHNFTRDIWVITVINTRRTSVISTLIGHSALVVEGREENGLFFVGAYDIQSGQIHEGWHKSHISKIRVWEDNTLSSVTEELPEFIERYKSCTRTSWLAHNDDAKRMIESIHNDKNITEKAKAGEDDFLIYRFLGSGRTTEGFISILWPKGNGVNCAEWCMDKLKIADINPGGKPKPELIAGGTLCNIS